MLYCCGAWPNGVCAGMFGSVGAAWVWKFSYMLPLGGNWDAGIVGFGWDRETGGPDGGRMPARISISLGDALDWSWGNRDESDEACILWTPGSGLGRAENDSPKPNSLALSGFEVGGVGWKGAPKLLCWLGSVSAEVMALKGESPNGSSNGCTRGKIRINRASLELFSWAQ